MATISSEVATGRRIKGLDGLMRGVASYRSLRWRRIAFAPPLLDHLPPGQCGRVTLVDFGQQRLAARQVFRLVLDLVQEALALLGRGGCAD